MKLGNKFEKDTYFEGKTVEKAVSMVNPERIIHVVAFKYNENKFMGMVHLEGDLFFYMPEKVAKFIVEGGYVDMINNNNCTYRVWKDIANTGRECWYFDIEVED